MIQVSNSEGELNRSSSVCTSRFVFVRAFIGSEKEEEEMPLIRKRGFV